MRSRTYVGSYSKLNQVQAHSNKSSISCIVKFHPKRNFYRTLSIGNLGEEHSNVFLQIVDGRITLEDFLQTPDKIVYASE